MFTSILSLLSGAVSLFNKAVSYFNKKDDQATGASLQAAQTTSDNLAVTQAELKAATDAPKTDAAVADRLGKGTF